MLPMVRTNNFGIALRGWRERLSPLEGGLAAEDDEDRRIPGLRREELALLAGLSVDYVIRLEQGRARNPSAQVVAALARALRLDTAERDHLFRCAQLAPPAGGAVSMHVPARVHRLVRQLGDTPVAVFAADWTIISWNAMWSAVVGDPHTYDWQERNLVTGMFRSDGRPGPDSVAAWPVRSRHGEEAEEAALVADLRVTAAAYPADVRLAALVEHMLSRSPRFARLWFNGTARALVGDLKTVSHPSVGEIALDLDVLMVAGADLRIVTYTAAAETADEAKMAALRATCDLPRQSRVSV